MVAFIKSMDSKTCKEVINGWTPPKVTTEDGTETLKPEKDWSKEEDEEAHDNSRALNAIYNGVDKNISRVINTCSNAKEASKLSKLHTKASPRFTCQDFKFLQKI